MFQWEIERCMCYGTLTACTSTIHTAARVLGEQAILASLRHSRSNVRACRGAASALRSRSSDPRRKFRYVIVKLSEQASKAAFVPNRLGISSRRRKRLDESCIRCSMLVSAQLATLAASSMQLLISGIVVGKISEEAVDAEEGLSPVGARGLFEAGTNL